MNQRIKELANQARIRDHWSVDEGRYITNYLDEQKFAHMIALDTIKDCRDQFVVNSVSWNLLNDKLEHFGVEP